jgi:hypothetical protein
LIKIVFIYFIVFQVKAQFFFLIKHKNLFLNLSKLCDLKIKKREVFIFKSIKQSFLNRKMFAANLKQIQKNVGNNKRREPILAQSYPYQYDSMGSFRFAEESYNNLNSSYTRHLKFRQNHSALACHAMNYVTNERWLRREVKDLLGLRKFSNNLIVKAESKEFEISKLSRLLKGKVEHHNFERQKSNLTSYNSDNACNNSDHDDAHLKPNTALNFIKEAKSETKSINLNIDHKDLARKIHRIDSNEDIIDFKNELSLSRSISALSNQGNTFFIFNFLIDTKGFISF